MRVDVTYMFITFVNARVLVLQRRSTMQSIKTKQIKQYSQKEENYDMK